MTVKAHYTPTYQSWQAMKQRCLQTGHKHYDNYGGRGITICERWLTYANFLADLGARPDGCSLDRIDSNGPYSLDNCRWATKSQQSRNSSQNRMISFRGQTKCLAEWCEVLNLKYARTYMRLFRLNWSIEDALR